MSLCRREAIRGGSRSSYTGLHSGFGRGFRCCITSTIAGTRRFGWRTTVTAYSTSLRGWARFTYTTTGGRLSIGSRKTDTGTFCSRTYAFRCGRPSSGRFGCCACGFGRSWYSCRYFRYGWSFVRFTTNSGQRFRNGGCRYKGVTRRRQGYEGGSGTGGATFGCLRSKYGYSCRTCGGWGRSRGFARRTRGKANFFTTSTGRSRAFRMFRQATLSGLLWFRRTRRTRRTSFRRFRGTNGNFSYSYTFFGNIFRSVSYFWFGRSCTRRIGCLARSG